MLPPKIHAHSHHRIVTLTEITLTIEGVKKAEKGTLLEIVVHH